MEKWKCRYHYKYKYYANVGKVSFPHLNIASPKQPLAPKDPSNKMPVFHISRAVDNSRRGGHLKSHSSSIKQGGNKITMTSPPTVQSTSYVGAHSPNNAYLSCHWCQQRQWQKYFHQSRVEFLSLLFSQKWLNMTSKYRVDAVIAISIVAITELQSVCITSHESPQANIQVTT